MHPRGEIHITLMRVLCGTAPLLRQRILGSSSSSSSIISAIPWVGGALARLQPQGQEMALSLADHVWVKLETAIHLHDQHNTSLPQQAVCSLFSIPLHHYAVIFKFKALLHVPCVSLQAWLDLVQLLHRRYQRLAAKEIVHATGASSAAAATGDAAGAVALTLSLISVRLKDSRGMVPAEPLTW